jgi:ATP-dependent 26S proteasome regulatory subunit
MKKGGSKMAKEKKKDSSMEELCSALLQGVQNIIEEQMEDDDVSPYDELVANYLDTDRDGLSIESKSFPPYKKNLMLIAIANIIKENYGGGGQAFAISEFEEVQNPPRYTTIKSSPTNEDKCLWFGYQQLENSEGRKLIIEVDCSNKSPFYNIITTKDDVDLATKLMAEVDDFIVNRNVYMGQVIEVDSDGTLDFMKMVKKTWDDVIIPDDIRDELIYNAIWPIEKSDIFKSNGLSTKRGIMLEGKPGVGKTMAVSVIASLMTDKATTIWIPARSVGQADDIAQIYTAARELSPCILLFEDIDLIATDRSTTGNYSPVLGELLGQLDGLEVNNCIITIATTNYPEAIEKALRDRPSRFDRRIQFDLPTKDARRKMLNIFTSKLKLDDDVDLDVIADLSNKFTGAYMRELVSTAVIEAIKESPDKKDITVCQRNLIAAVNKFKDKGKKFGFMEL